MPSSVWVKKIPSWPELYDIFVGRTLVSPETYRELADDARTWAFSIARASSATMLRRAQDRLAQLIGSGEQMPAWVDWVEGSGEQWSEAYSELVNRMATLSTYSVARWQQMNTPDSIKDFDYLMYDAINDDRVRPEHLAMDNKVWKRSEFPVQWIPPNGYNCRCRIRQVNEYLLRRSGGVLQTGPPGGKPDQGFQANSLENYAQYLERQRIEAESKL